MVHQYLRHVTRCRKALVWARWGVSMVPNMTIADLTGVAVQHIAIVNLALVVA